MLQRSVTRCLSRRALNTPCTTRVCSCWRRFLPDTGGSEQRRGKVDISNASPAVGAARRREARRTPLSAAEKHKREQQELEDHNWHLAHFERAVRLNLVSTDEASITDFLSEFAHLCNEAGYRRPGASPVPEEELQDLIAKLNINEYDCSYVAHALLVSPRAQDKEYGRKLMYALSHVGSEIATMRIIKQVLMEAKHKPAKLSNKQIQHMRKHLAQVAEKGENYRATVLEGKVQYALGNHNAAIEMWTKAMGAAVSNAEDLAARKAKGELQRDRDALPGTDTDDLDAPWIELATVHIQRQEWAKARWVVAVGCEQDDPTSHYNAAIHFERRTDANGELLATSKWLYHMTKAAASGHWKAAHELGNFYAHSLWPYIEDEPPDHVKPTPFDRYPPDSDGEKKSGWGLGGVVRQLLGLEAKTREEPNENLFRTATFPSTPEGRMRIAHEWLEVAWRYTYAPAHLLAAKLYLEKTLWSDAAASKAALNLSDERYTYASKADCDADKPIERPATNLSADNSSSPEAADSGPDELPNPLYDPDRAKDHIRKVFRAHFAQHARAEHLIGLARFQKKQGRTTIDPSDMEELEHEADGMVDIFAADGKRLQEPLPYQVRMWYRNQEVRESYSDDRELIIFDDTMVQEGGQRLNLLEAAKGICEEQEWDIYDEKGGLIYRHGMKAPPKGKVEDAKRR